MSGSATLTIEASTKSRKAKAHSSAKVYFPRLVARNEIGSDMRTSVEVALTGPDGSLATDVTRSHHRRRDRHSGMAMDSDTWQAEQFERHRAHLRAVAYRMLGSVSEADDAVQEAWLRLSRSDGSAIENMGGWLTTVVGRVCIDML